jgi:hypothetical protein
LGNETTLDRGNPLHLPERTAAFEASEFQAQLISGFHRPFEFHVVQSGEDKNLGIARPAPGIMGEDRAYLGHSLTDEYSRHDRTIGKMPLKEILIKGDILDTDDLPIAVDLDDAIDEQKRITMRKIIEYFLDVEHAVTNRSRVFSRAALPSSLNYVLLATALAIAEGGS